MPARRLGVNFGEREVVDLVGEGFVACQALCALDLGEDHAKMGDEDHITASMCAQEAINGAVDAR